MQEIPLSIMFLLAEQIRKFSVCFQGPKFFNSPPNYLINIVSTILFEKELKHYLSLNY